MVVLFSSISHRHTVSFPLLSLSTFFLELFLFALLTSCCHHQFPPVLCECVCICGPYIIYRCLHAYRCVCVSVIECPHRHKPFSGLIYLSLMLFFQPIHSLSSLPANSSHLSFLVCFHFLSVHLLHPSHLSSFIFSCVLVFFLVIIRLFSLRHFSSLPGVPLSCSISPSALLLDLFLQLHISFRVVFHPIFTLLSPVFCWPYPSLLPFPTSSPPPLPSTLPSVADLFFAGLPSLLLLLFIFMLCSVICFLNLSHILSRFLTPLLCTLWKSSPCLSPLSPSFLHRPCPSLTRLFLNRIPFFCPSFFLYTPDPPFFSFHNIPSYFCAKHCPICQSLPFAALHTWMPFPLILHPSALLSLFFFFFLSIFPPLPHSSLSLFICTVLISSGPMSVFPSCLTDTLTLTL